MHNTNVKTQPRVQRGVPAGGRFAQVNRPGSGTLGLTDVDDPTGVEGVTDAQILDTARRWSRRYAYKLGLEADDLEGDLLVRFYDQIAKHSELRFANVQAYINTLAHNIAIETLSGAHSYTRQAYRRYNQLCEAEMQRLNRELTPPEEDEIAAGVISAQPPGRRAPAKFHKRIYGYRHRPDGDSIIKRPRGVEHLEDPYRPGDTGELDGPSQGVVDLVARGERTVAVRRSWDALAGLRGSSVRVATSSVTERRAAAARRVVAGAGGMANLARRYASGLVEDQAEIDAMFTPYGELSDDEQEQAVAIFRSHPDLADNIWDAAMTAATKRRRQAR
ncbi:MAG: hypothetical protein ACYCR4_07385 [Acidimicrobiales bacterium]